MRKPPNVYVIVSNGIYPPPGEGLKNAIPADSGMA